MNFEMIMAILVSVIVLCFITYAQYLHTKEVARKVAVIKAQDRIAAAEVEEEAYKHNTLVTYQRTKVMLEEAKQEFRCVFTNQLKQSRRVFETETNKSNYNRGV